MNLIIAGPIFPEWYWTPIFFLIIYGLPIITLTLAIFFFSRRISKRKGLIFNTKYTFLKILLSVTAIFIVGNILYSYYLDNRSGTINPYTQECIKYGYEGAKGDSCIGSYDESKDFNLSEQNPYRLD